MIFDDGITADKSILAMIFEGEVKLSLRDIIGLALCM